METSLSNTVIQSFTDIPYASSHVAVSDSNLPRLVIPSSPEIPTKDIVDTIRKYNKNRHYLVEERDLTEYFNRHFRDLVPNDFQQLLDCYYYKGMDEHDKTVENLGLCVNASRMYLSNLKKHMFHIFNDHKIQLKRIGNIIARTRVNKVNYYTNLSNFASIDSKRESDCLGRISKFPDEIIRLIADFAFVPMIRYEFTRAKCGDLNTRLHSIKAKNLKLFVKTFGSQTHSIYLFLYKVVPIGGYSMLVNMFDISPLVRNFGSGLNKEGNMRRIVEILHCCDVIIHNLHRREKHTVFLKQFIQKVCHLYHGILYVSRPEFNLRQIRPRKTQTSGDILM